MKKHVMTLLVQKDTRSSLALHQGVEDPELPTDWHKMLVAYQRDPYERQVLMTLGDAIALQSALICSMLDPSEVAKRVVEHQKACNLVDLFFKQAYTIEVVMILDTPEHIIFYTIATDD